MGRHCSPEFQAHLDSGATTVCAMARITPVTPGYPAYGVTDLDRDVTYLGLTYSAAVGMQPSAVAFSAAMSVDNAEAKSLMPEYDVPISETDIRAGVYDYAQVWIFLVNYEDLSIGHMTLLEGTIGQVSIDSNGLSVVNEWRGLAAQLKQSVCEKDSLPCRAIYGSQKAGSATPGPIQRFPCGKDATAELVSGTVAEVGLENTLTFKLASTTLVADALNPGMVFFTSGMNEGQSREIESNTVDGWITLRFEAMFPIAEDDELQYRPDCNKIARDASKGCKAPHHWSDAWPLHFRGEPDIPIGDAGSMETPGASSSPGSGSPDYVPLTDAE